MCHIIADDKIDVDIAASNKTEDLIGGFMDETSKSFDHNLQKEIIALTYFDIIKELWKLDSSGAKFASFILFTTGAIWPHCMLLLLHFYVSIMMFYRVLKLLPDTHILSICIMVVLCPDTFKI